MFTALIPFALAQAAAAQSAGVTQPDARAPSSIGAAAPKGDWVTIADADLLVMELVPDAAGRPRRVVIQLMPAPFSQGWVANVRVLARAHWWDGLSVNRVQDNYVAQWGDAQGESAHPKPLPAGLRVMTEAAYTTAYDLGMFHHVWSGSGRVEARQKLVPVPASGPDWTGFDDPYANQFAFAGGFPAALTRVPETMVRRPAGASFGYGETYLVPQQVWPVHCYAMVGVGRNLSPDTGSGAELYTVIGHAPRHLDRNIALVGRVVEGIEFLSSLPRGTEALGFYRTPAERTAIRSVRLASELPRTERPQLQYLSTESASFAAYADARANRHDAFFIRPAGGADVCNIPVPVRRVP